LTVVVAQEEVSVRARSDRHGAVDRISAVAVNVTFAPAGDVASSDEVAASHGPWSSTGL
jgi:hypothetical protein